MKKRLYYIREFKEVNEGGISRDISFYQWILNENKYQIKKLKKNTNVFIKLIQSLKEIIFLLFIKDNIIFFHQSSLNLIYPINIFSNKYFEKVLIFLLKRLVEKNKLTIEINDLQYEQSIDLELFNKKIRKKIQKYQKIILNLKDVDYIFASEEMKKISIEKYNVDKKNAYTCINGSIKLTEKKEIEILKNEKKIKCIYAGTLNQGRQIKELIDIFENKLDKFKLVLIGINGEWILEKEYSNILYLGSYEEKEALNIVSNCDIGLVPYDNNRFYYNLCYPTKNSFYISAGIPLLITPLKESLNQLLKYDILFVETLDKWENLLKKISIKEIKIKKENINEIKKNFLWENLIEEVFCKIREGSEENEKDRDINISLSK